MGMETQTEPTATKALAATLYTYCGSSVQLEMAVRHSDGARFTRMQYRTPRYGYKWTAWKPTSAMPVYTSNGDDPACWSETGSGWVLASWQRPVRLPR